VLKIKTAIYLIRVTISPRYTPMQSSIVGLGLLTGLLLMATVTSASQFEPQRKLDEAAAKFASDSTKLPALVEAVFSMSHIAGGDLNQLPVPVASLLKNKVTVAEQAYWAGQHSGVTEQNIADALNGLATALVLPDYAQTTARQVRKLRFQHMTEWTPGFLGLGLAVHKTDKGATAIPTTMSPLQAFHITLTMIDQKFVSPEYQRTPSQGEAHAVSGIYHAGNTPALAEMRDRYKAGLAALNDAQALEMLTDALRTLRVW
jgi:hypothetical protein